MSTPDPDPPNTNMEARDSSHDISDILKKLKHALEALDIDDPAQPSNASGLQDVRSPDTALNKNRSPPQQQAQPEPDDPMKDTIIPSRLFALSRFDDAGGHYHNCAEQPRPKAT
ncbi:hypothetical protein CYLTODRAFT_460491, partial [Cylindrobasidium torrendii FP15055 ss-10]